MKIDMKDAEYITETSVTIRGSRRRITLPKYIVEKIGIKDGDKIRWILLKDGTIYVMKVE